jgi:serine/threonine protein kinase
MTPERWKEVERLYLASIELEPDQRRRFLADASADEEIRREVESLLAHRAAGLTFLERRGVDVAAEIVTRNPTEPLIGRTIGRYHVASLLGAGGMGIVYRAHDTRLGRDVALKILPEDFSRDPDPLIRFEREARLLASLNHPNIAAIYDLNEFESIQYLVLEFIEGETLAARLQRGSIPFGEALTICRQIAEALEAAHEHGVVHRDLKPANVMTTPNGAVKVLDFGIAKLLAADGSPSPSGSTDTLGAFVVGTPSYMSPEQARGKPVDKRTDIWAFGCVLYEMLTGRMAFAGQTTTDTLAAILEREPNWRFLPDATPITIRRLLRRCLEKDSKRRLRDIGDVRIEIDEALSSPGQPESATGNDWTRALRGWRTVAIVSLAALVIVGGTLTARLIRAPRSGPETFGPTRMTASRLTSYSGRQYAAALAPDGRSFVFVSNHAGSPDVWLRQVSGGEPVRLTNDAVEESDLVFSPDGESVYFTRVDEDGEAIWQIGTLGGQPRKVIASGHSAAPSPDGRTLAYMTVEAEDLSEALVVSRLDGSDKRSLARRVPGFPRVRPAWSRDGVLISFVRAGLFAPANLFIVDTRSGQERQVTRFTRPAQGVGQHAWRDNHHVVVSYVPDPSHIPVANDLAILNADDGSITRFTTTISDNFLSPSLSADGSRLVATATGVLREVWKVPLKSADPDVNGKSAVRLMDRSQDPFWIFVTRDGQSLLYNSPASGSRNLWTMPLDGSSKARQITALSGDAISHSAMSPDGTRVAFVSFVGGASDIWTQNVDGTDLRQLTKDPAADSWPVWSPDGRSIAFSSVRDGLQQTWVVPSNGGPGEKLIDGFFRGDWVEKPGGAGIWIVTSNNASRVRLIDVEKRLVLWEERVANADLPLFSPDRRSISVAVEAETGGSRPAGRSPALIGGGGTNTVAILDVATRQQRIVARLPFPILFRASWVDSGTALIVNRNDPVSQIVMFDRFWEPERR